MVEIAAHLVDHVIPPVPVRQRKKGPGSINSKRKFLVLRVLYWFLFVRLSGAPAFS
jgi:hypothetical protein